jgi:Na+/H+ antiporter NhaD/arsenite permease-like protein
VSAALAQVSELLFFLLGAMIVVEVVDAHDGFRPLAAAVRTDDRRHLAALVAGAAFFLSSVLDNLTTTIVVVSLLQRLVPNDRELRLLLGSITVVAANAGGAWTPIGDVTTTMLWIHGQVRAVRGGKEGCLVCGCVCVCVCA